MSLTPGTKLGPYEIVAPIGAGGMGEVYKARDTRLDREVAIKVLPSHLSNNADLKARFEREARAISALKHPHICTLHDIGREGEVDYLVLEHLEGDTLAQRLLRGALPLAELLKVATQIADGLDRAHRSGIVHRDLKPGNVMLEKSGAKLLDFGLAKAMVAGVNAGSGSPPSFAAAATMEQAVSPLTTAGTVVGTIQYMSPEQIEGREADPRSDIFSFGAMLYEMATGKRAFQGKSQLSIASAILEKAPEPISAIQPLSPPELERLISACLEKDPEERIQTAHDVRLQLRWINEGSGSPSVATVGSKWKAKTAAWMVIPFFALALVPFGVSALLQRPPETRTVRASLPAPEKKVIDDIQLSPDGDWVAIAMGEAATAEQQIWVRRLDQDSARPVDAADKGEEPFWSPSGDALAFFVKGKLKRVDIAGGPALPICDAFRGAGTWGSRGEILFSSRFGGNKLLRVSASGGAPQPVPMEDGWQADRPFFLPDGDQFLYEGFDRSPKAAAEQGIYVTSLAGGRGQILIKGAFSPRYAKGHIFFIRGGALMMQRFDPKALKVQGNALLLVERLAESRFGSANYSVSDSNMAYLGQSSSSGASLTWFDREGRPLSQVGGTDIYYNPALSNDGKRLAVDVGRVGDIWIYDLDRPTRTRLTFGAETDWGPVWAPDGKRLAYTSWSADGSQYKLLLKNSSGVGEPELLTESAARMTAAAWSPDGKYLLYVLSESGSEDIWMMPLDGERKSEVFLRGPYLEREPAFSYDGKWVAYLSTESGEEEVYVTDFPARRSKWQVSLGNGDRPRWSASGREIFYLSNTDGLMAVPVEPVGGEMRIGNAHQLFQTRPRRPGAIYQVMPDGKRFLVVERGEASTAPASLVLNWKPLPD
ncbi:MAG TPA: protein kinase [Terriglobales bacterium]|nr:protein kinase [Terriglobales bacterium]